MRPTLSRRSNSEKFRRLCATSSNRLDLLRECHAKQHSKTALTGAAQQGTHATSFDKRLSNLFGLLRQGGNSAGDGGDGTPVAARAYHHAPVAKNVQIQGISCLLDLMHAMTNTDEPQLANPFEAQQSTHDIANPATTPPLHWATNTKMSHAPCLARWLHAAMGPQGPSPVQE